MARKSRKMTLAYGEGTLHQRSNGLWVGAIEAGVSETGTRRRITVSSMDKDAAYDKLLRKRQLLEAEGVAEAARTSPTVQAWSEQWLADIKGRDAPQGYQQRVSRVKRWIVPIIGRTTLDQLSAASIRKIHAAMEQAARSSTTVKNVHSTLVTMLRAAQAEGHKVPESVFAMRRPTEAVSSRRDIPLDDAVALIKTSSTEPDAARWVAALLQGMRQAECLGLTWDAIDFDTREIEISWQVVSLRYEDRKAKQLAYPPGFEYRHLWGVKHLARPKSKAGYRRVPMVPWMHDSLIAWREVAPKNPQGLVWPQTAYPARPRGADADREAWAALTDRADVYKVAGVRADDGTWASEPERYTLHEARHTTATLLGALGIDPEVIKAIMGWSKVSMRATYTHAQAEQMREAMAAVATKLHLDPAP